MSCHDQTFMMVRGYWSNQHCFSRLLLNCVKTKNELVNIFSDVDNVSFEQFLRITSEEAHG